MTLTNQDRESLAECRKAFEGQFMQPKFYRGVDLQSELMEAGLDVEDDAIYCRLSADGFMDCTDWHGPYATAHDAAQALIDSYGGEF